LRKRRDQCVSCAELSQRKLERGTQRLKEKETKRERSICMYIADKTKDSRRGLHRFMCLYHTFISVYIYIYVYQYMYIYICIYTYMCIYIYIYTYVHIHVYTYTYINIYIYMYIYIHIYIYIFIFIRYLTRSRYLFVIFCKHFCFSYCVRMGYQRITGK